MTESRTTPGVLGLARPLLLDLILIILLVACQQSDLGQPVRSEVVVVEGQEVVVTRVVRRAVQPPATVTPVASQEEPAILDVAMSGEPAQIDPQRASSESAINLVENLFVGLTRYNHAANRVEPELATEWEVSQDGRTWTFHLRRDIFWIRSGVSESTSLLPRNRGPEAYRPVVADDVVYAIQRACNPQTQTPDVLVLFIIEGCREAHQQVEVTEAQLADIAARALDDFTLEITLTKPATYFETITTLWLLRPVPREIVEAFADTSESWATMENVMTSGRFIIGPDSVANTQTVLQRNPFWPDPFQGTVSLVNIFWLANDEAYEMWLEKNVDVSPLPPDRREEVMADTRLRPRVRLVSNQAVFYLAFNLESPVFSEPAVRRAFTAAIDRQVLVEEVYGTRGIPMRHFSPPGVLGAPPIEEVGVGYSPDWARIRMQESSIRDCGFLPPIRYLASSTDLALHHAETLRSMWVRELGCPEENIVIEQVQFGTLLANTRADAGVARPDIWDLGWASYFPDAHNWLYDVLHCTESENRQNRTCSELDRILEQAAISTSVEERWSLYRDAEQMLFGEDGLHPIAPLYVQGRYVLVHPWLLYEPARFGGEQFDTYRLDAPTKRLERQQ